MAFGRRKKTGALPHYMPSMHLLLKTIFKNQRRPGACGLWQKCYVIPVLSAQAAKAQLTAENEQYVVYARKDMAF